MEPDQKFELIRQNTEEVLTEESLKQLVESDTPLKHYIGFEISGKIHLGTGLMCMLKVKDLQEAGVECNIFLADWHSWINNKLGGDMEVIQDVAVNYFKEGLKASLECVGGDSEDVNFILGSELYEENEEYWRTVIDISKNTTLSRMKRSITIAGREEGESVDFATLIYPPMQVADIFSQGINIAQAGTDQRKAQVIARDVAGKLEHSPLKDKDGNIIKPSVIHHHLILGLGKPPKWPISEEERDELWTDLKMSKSKPKTCVYIHDSPDDIREKLKDAFCPEGEIEFNPVLDWCEHLIMPLVDEIKVERPEKYGGDVVYETYEEVEKDFEQEELHPLDLKEAVAEELIDILEPAREHFNKPEINEMLKEMNNLVVTR